MGALALALRADRAPSPTRRTPPGATPVPASRQSPGACIWTLPGGSAPRYRQLYALIRDHLAQGDLQPGDRLPDERRLARLCGVSRLTVRGALALLSADGVVSRRTRVGTVICSVAD